MNAARHVEIADEIEREVRNHPRFYTARQIARMLASAARHRRRNSARAIRQAHARRAMSARPPRPRVSSRGSVRLAAALHGDTIAG